MKSILTLVCSCLLSAAFANDSAESTSKIAVISAENTNLVSRIDYQLPEIAKDWKETKMVNEEASSVILIPRKSSIYESFRMSTSNTNDFDFSNLTDSVKKDVQKKRPGVDCECFSVEQSADSFYYEISLRTDGNEFYHSWVRGFIFEDKMITLTYSSSEAKDPSVWVKALKEAKVKGA